ncbi:radical SAM family RiPP maturation amino acid epimerase [Catenovulum sediminis]|uniref:Radical SAM family RiPP maturation amino acid epimerase n=1 Tax=Catenovulum sediminis TaxID=1740262 RepID=A0ABV1RIT2_9ALTE
METKDKSSFKSVLEPFRFEKVIAQFSTSELNKVSQIKRFFELYQGDEHFREQVNDNSISESYVNYLKDIGIQFKISDITVLWQLSSDYFETLSEYKKLVFSQKNTDEVYAKLAKYPLLALWFRYSTLKEYSLTKFVQLMNESPWPSYNVKFESWRKRRIKNIHNELGNYGRSLDHPVVAIELAQGCSVGCNFCAYDAKKLETVFDYTNPENVTLFRQVATSIYEQLGELAGGALLYYSTEPLDNPNYLSFLKEYESVTGYVLCTATAGCDNESQLSELIDYYTSKKKPWPRLSVISKGVLRRVHRAFSPEALSNVGMIMQMKLSAQEKVKGGRILAEVIDKRDNDELSANDIPQGSIACVTGFLINMVNRSIKLVSPCYTSRLWPYGYRVYDEDTFTMDNFNEVLESMIQRNMMEKIDADMLLKWRDDLSYQRIDGGFTLTSPCYTQKFVDFDIYPFLGEMLNGDGCLYRDLCDALLLNHQCDPIKVSAVLQKLFETGLFDELKHFEYKNKSTYQSEIEFTELVN